MGAANMPAGMVKKESLIIGVIVALAVGFFAGVIYSSFKSPLPVAGGTAKPAQSQGGQGQAPAGPSAEQATKIASLELEVGRNPANGGAWTQLGNLYFDTRQPPKAIEAYKKSLEINQAQPDVWTDLGVMYRSNQQFKEAIVAFDRAAVLAPGHEQALFNKGIVLIYDLGDKAAGIQAWQQVVAINPNAMAPNGQTVKSILASLK